MMDLILIRDGLKSDEPFIYQSWLKGYLYGLQNNKEEPQYINVNRGLEIGYFEQNYRLVIEKLLGRSKIQVACLKDSPDVILGYVASEGDRLHWAFIKPTWRGFKILHQLLPKDWKSVSHKTFLFERILRKRFPHITYNPFL